MYRLATLVWHDPTPIHPDDFPEWQNRFGAVGIRNFNFEEIGVDGEYKKLLIEGQKYRVKPAAIHEHPPSNFAVGQRVKVLNGTPRQGAIYSVVWHHKRQKHVYLLEVEGYSKYPKKLTRQYEEEDLELVDQ